MSERKKRRNILIIPSWYPTSSRPYHGIFIRRHVEAIAVHHNPIVLYISSQLQSKWIQLEKVSEGGIVTLRWTYSKNPLGIPFLDKLMRGLLFVVALSKSKKALQNEGITFDVVHAHVLGRLGNFAYRLSRMWKIPLVVTEHWSGYILKSEINETRSKILKSAQRISVVSDYLKDNIKAKVGVKKKIDVIPNVVIDEFLESATECESSDKINILNISDLDDNIKGLSELLGAVKHLVQSRKDILVHFIGAGSDEDFLKMEVERLGVKEYVKFHGELGRDKLVEQIRNASFVISNSRMETFGITILESLAMNTPVLTNELPTLSSFVNEANGGLSMSHEGEEGLAKKMNEMLNQLDQWKSLDSRHYVASHYSEEVIAAKFDEVYNSILEDA